MKRRLAAIGLLREMRGRNAKKALAGRGLLDAERVGSRQLDAIARVIMFDERGSGLSDRALGLRRLDERSPDIAAVMDVEGSERALLRGVSEGRRWRSSSPPPGPTVSAVSSSTGRSRAVRTHRRLATRSAEWPENLIEFIGAELRPSGVPRRRHRRRRAQLEMELMEMLRGHAAVVVGLALVVAACGDDDGAADTTELTAEDTPADAAESTAAADGDSTEGVAPPTEAMSAEDAELIDAAAIEALDAGGGVTPGMWIGVWDPAKGTRSTCR